MVRAFVSLTLKWSFINVVRWRKSYLSIQEPSNESSTVESIIWRQIFGWSRTNPFMHISFSYLSIKSSFFHLCSMTFKFEHSFRLYTWFLKPFVESDSGIILWLRYYSIKRKMINSMTVINSWKGKYSSKVFNFTNVIIISWWIDG